MIILFYFRIKLPSMHSVHRFLVGANTVRTRLALLQSYHNRKWIQSTMINTPKQDLEFEEKMNRKSNDFMNIGLEEFKHDEDFLPLADNSNNQFQHRTNIIHLHSPGL